MRYYNIYTYANCPAEQNVDNYPGYWIWKIENANQFDPVPENSVRVSLTELMQYKQTHKDNYNLWVKSKADSYAPVDKKVKKAIKGVNDLMNRVCSENIVMGITQSGKTKLIADAMKDVFYYAQTGSLYECYNALGEIQPTEEMSPFLTPTRITTMREQIMNLLTNL